MAGRCGCRVARDFAAVHIDGAGHNLHYDELERTVDIVNVIDTLSRASKGGTMFHYRPGTWTASQWLVTPILALAAFGASIVAGPLQAHHSFAVHYDSDLTITQEGVVAEFRFTNPHGILLLDVTNDDGTVERWTAETSAPVYMRRFGWTPDMVAVGDHIIIDGYASRDGSHLMRIRTMRRPDGTQIGGRLQAGDQ